MIQISDHVIQRYRQRCNSSYNKKKIKAKLIDMWERGTPAEIKKEFRAFQMAKHGVDNVSEYRIRGNFVLVASKGTMVTLHLNESERFQPASFLKTYKCKEKVFRIACQLESLHEDGFYCSENPVSQMKFDSKQNELFMAVREYNKAKEEE